MAMQKKVSKVISKMAEQVINQNVNSSCFFFFYQPKLPNGIIKAKK
ncbi:cyclic lactone autoinducer peptide [Anaeromicropila populeti]|uniref:Cyclic lactone autoinducer peptide n=1 Tax=Anaeromicropila populeti TaxID=37658 RepID=A0A1I6J2F5_9FIRM|nr:cyclic lactone autoinducer peptide [Anaeromicropila populeti]SFR73153.1 cyclic lactone autoinducer peptide [Anaeromicropila populeti]